MWRKDALGVLGQGYLPHPINKVMEDINVTAASTAGSHNGEHEESATPLVHYTHSTLHTHHTSHTHYIPEAQAPQCATEGSTKLPEGQQARSRRPRSPDTHTTTRRTRARLCEHKTDSKQCQDVSMSQHSDSTGAQRHDESPCALSQAHDQAGDGCSSTWAAAQSPVAVQLPPTTSSLCQQGHNLGTLRRVVHAVQSDFVDVETALVTMALHVPYESPVVIIDLGRMGTAVLQVDWGDHVGMIALFAIMQLGSLDRAGARMVLMVCNMWTRDHQIENVARFPAGYPGHTRSPTVAAAGLQQGSTLYVRGHPCVNASEESCEGALAGQPRCPPIAWSDDLFPLVHHLLHEQISWDLIDDRMEAQLREITSSRQRAIRRSDSFDIDMYADVMQHGTAWCGGHTESDAQGSMMRELPMLTSQHTQPANDLSLANSVHAAAHIRRTVFFGEAHRFQTLQQPRVQSSPRPVRPRQFTTLGLQDAQNAVANTLRAASRQLLQARFEMEIPQSVPYGPNMTCPPSSPFTDTDVAKITTTLQRLVREVAKEVHTAPGVPRRAIATSLSVRRVPHNIRFICIQTVIAGLLSVTVVCIYALHQFVVLMCARTLRVVCLPLRICMNSDGTTLCISALCRHENHACAPMGRRGMGCQQVLCNHCNTTNAYFSCCVVPVAHS